MTAEEFLRGKFDAKGLPAFAPDDLYEEWSHSAFLNKATPPTANGDLARIAAQPDLKRHLATLDTDFRKFKFGEVQLADWDKRYQFPRHRTIKAFMRRPDHRGLSEGAIVNRSKDTIDGWVSDDLIPAIKARVDRITVLIGDVGSGKTTFNKLLKTRYHPVFRGERIVVSRVEYRKLDVHVGKHYNHQPNADQARREKLRSLIEQVVFCSMLRDLFHAGWSELHQDPESTEGAATFAPTQECAWPEIDLRDASVQNKLVAFAEDRYGPEDEQKAAGIDLAKTIQEVKRAIREFTSPQLRDRRRWYYEVLGDPERQARLEPFAQFVEAEGIQTFVIFDGLDYVQISDFIGYTRHRENLEAIASWLTDGNKVCLPRTRGHLYPAFQVTMRPNTHELFWRDYSQALIDLETPTYYIVPAEFRDIVRNATRAPLFTSDDGVANVAKDEILEFFSKIQVQLGRVLGLRPRQIDDLFMQNVRYRVHFARNVLEELFQPALETLEKSGRERSRENLLERLRHETTELLERKEYRLVDMLLHAKNERFANFIRIEGDGIDLTLHQADPSYLQNVLRDNNTKSGYVGNVFNYHIPYEGYDDIEFLLEKLRILDLLIESGPEPLRVEEIVRKFEKRGWRTSPFFDFSLAILIRENMVAGHHFEAGSYGYEATTFGRMLRAHLVPNMIYLENVFFGTFLPRGVKRFAKDVYRRSSQRHEWVAASIYHCWLFLRLIRTAEQTGHSRFFEEIRASVAATVERIIMAKNADPKIAGFARRYIEDFLARAGQ
ncbi:MAG: hypothetical protein E7773_14880 [Sphingomonas sp.]|uniref:hypothetical protein n=1 Tax=Sphingomonas sp. TaxID=28214 RepID=UPI00121BD0F7|nr:hypothetical protein [Sphingomonas sp.]THD34471.1 MAG: hypothetical protein E7773_14880 [Sphingomonas sp.]